MVVAVSHSSLFYFLVSYPEDLLDRHLEVSGDLQRKQDRRGVVTLLDSDHRLAAYAERFGEGLLRCALAETQCVYRILDIFPHAMRISDLIAMSSMLYRLLADSYSVGGMRTVSMTNVTPLLEITSGVSTIAVPFTEICPEADLPIVIVSPSTVVSFSPSVRSAEV